MAEESKDGGEKTEDPSAHRIEEYRKKGEVASSKELNSVLVLSAAVLTLGLSTTFIYEQLSFFVEWLYSLNIDKAYTEKQFQIIVEKSAMTGLKCVGPLFLIVVCVGVFANVSQIGFLFSPEVLTFKPERINPIGGLKKLLTMRSVVEALKATLKFVFISAIVYFSLKDDLHTYKGFMHVDFVNSFHHGQDILIKLAFSIILGMAVIAIMDFAYQKVSYKKKLMMTKQEAKQESKEQDGNPEIKQKIRAIQREMAQKRMMSEVPTADVIVTNPTHISVALKYDPATMVSPIVLAKGSDDVAMKIREIAKDNDIPIVENVPLARGLHKTVKIGDVVPRTLYKAVAEVLAFVYKLKRKKRA